VTSPADIELPQRPFAPGSSVRADAVAYLEPLVLLLLYAVVYADSLARFAFFWNPGLYLLVRSTTDLIPAIALLLTLRASPMGVLRAHLQGTTALAAFAVLLVLASAAQAGDPVAGVVRAAAIGRFAPVAFLAWHLATTDTRFIGRLARHIHANFWILISIGIAQYFIGEPAFDLFMPLSAGPLSTAIRAAIERTPTATFANTVDFAYFLVATHAFLVYSNRVRIASTETLLGAVLLGLIGSAAALVAFGLSVVAAPGRSRSVLTATLATASIVLWSRLEDFAQTFLVGAAFGRIAFVAEMLPEYLSKASLAQLVFGLGASQDFVFSVVARLSSTPLIFLWDQGVNALDDVYYVSSIMYHGLAGTALLAAGVVCFFRGAYGAARTDGARHLLGVLVFCVAFGSLFNQVLHIRPFSMVLWTMLGLLAASPEPDGDASALAR